MKRWLLILFVSFAMYEVLWSVMELQLEELSFDAEEVLWDFAQCTLFTSAVFAVNWGFTKFRGGRYAKSVFEILTLLVVCSLLIYLVDHLVYVQDTADDRFWNVIDVYIICIICALLSVINIQHSYHKRLVTMKQEQMKLRLKLLQQQLSPHFMFNSLSTLQGMIASEPQKAEAYVYTLSSILRYVTENIGREKVPLPDAVGFIQSYVQLLDMRFPQHFVFRIALHDAPANAFVVPVSMQIAVENAIKHNKHSAKQPLEISIALESNNIVVSNRKHPIALPDSPGVGLKNLDERYRLLAGKGLEISDTDDYYSVKIPLLYESLDSRR